MSKASTRRHQQFAAIEEVRTAVGLLERGLAALQQIGWGNDFYHAPLLMLANGFERLQKVILWYAVLRHEGQPLTTRKLWNGRNGHDLIYLQDQIDEWVYARMESPIAPALDADRHLLSHDSRVRRVVSILSRFGISDRYHNMDVLLGTPPSTEAPEHEWQELETELLKDHAGWETELLKPASKKTYEWVTYDLTVLIETYARSLARLFTLGNLGPEAARHTGGIGPFLFLRDDDLGSRDYSRSERDT